MSTHSAQISGSILSLKISTINAIAALGMRAAMAEQAGDEVQRAALSHDAVRLAMEAAELRRAELRAKLEYPHGTDDPVQELKVIAAEAKEITANIEHAADILAKAERLITLIGNIAAKFA